MRVRKMIRLLRQVRKDHKVMTQEKFDYGEILFLGKCNNRCYYCLGSEMLKAQLVDNMETPYNELKNLDIFLDRLRNGGCNTVYLSSVETDPLLYKDIDNLCDCLISKGFKLGIRTNGLCWSTFLDIIPKLDAEISISINSLNNSTNERICGNRAVLVIPCILHSLKINNKKCRISIVINKFNASEIVDTVEYLQEFDNISYIQLRKRYRYRYCNDSFYKEDIEAFNFVKSKLSCRYSDVPMSNFHESIIYNLHVPVSLWEDVFKRESLSTLNYFTDGKITTNNLLVPSYENK